MKQKSGPDKAPAERVLKEIRRQTRRQYSAEETIRIVLEGLRGEENISELCRRYSLYDSNRRSTIYPKAKLDHVSPNRLIPRVSRALSAPHRHYNEFSSRLARDCLDDVDTSSIHLENISLRSSTRA